VAARTAWGVPVRPSVVMVPVPVRLRQVVLITSDLPGVVRSLERDLGLHDPYEDVGVASFGLENRVLTAGDCFVEVVTPITEDCTGARYLKRRGGDGGYMAIFQFADRDAARARAGQLGIRTVWTGDLPGMAGTHLHPLDVPGAIVSLDWADPPQSWLWAGPAWTGGAPGSTVERRGGLVGLTVAAGDPAALARRWAEVLGSAAPVPDTEAGRSGTWTVALAEANQVLRFVPAGTGVSQGITGYDLALPVPPVGHRSPVVIGGVTFTVGPVDPA
jgi:hypothetical protein